MGSWAARSERPTRSTVYVFEQLLAAEELADLQTELETLLENAPAAKGAMTDRQGRPVAYPTAYTFAKPLSDEFGGTKFGIYLDGVVAPRHQLKMREPPTPSNAPREVLTNVMHPLAYMDSALRAYGNPRLLKVAEALLGPDFTPFSELVFYKPAGVGVATAWHQDPSAAWDAAWSRPGFDLNTCGCNLHLALSSCAPAGALWVLPGSHTRGRVDQKALSASGDGSDRLPGAVPVLAQPGDVYLQSRLVLHGAFPNVGADPRITLQFGFLPKSAVLGRKGRTRRGEQVYDEEFIKERSRMIPLAIDARKQRFPEEQAYSYAPFRDEEEQAENRWTPELKQNLYGKYWERTLSC